MNQKAHNQEPITHPRLQVRWMIRRDMPDVMAIEDKTINPWTMNEFHAFLRERNCIGLVAEHGTDIRGFIVYELLKDRLSILNLAVAPNHRRMGIGRAIIELMQRKIVTQKRHTIEVVIRESNLPGQLFFKSLGFAATEVMRGEYEDPDEDGYRLEYVDVGHQ